MSSGENHVLGISAFFHDSAAVVIADNKILAAAQEERFTRKKGDASFPINAIQYCLSFIPPDKEPDAIAYYENPVLKLDRIFKNSTQNYPRGAPLWLQTMKTAHAINNKLPQYLNSLVKDPENIFFVPHHQSHAASAYYPSGLSDSAILVVDGVGEFATTSIWHGKGDSLTGLKELQYPNSLGLLYSAFTQYCGFKINSGEYKLMGLAPFGKPRFKRLIYKNLIEVKEDGSFQLNLKYFSYMTDNSTINPLFGGLFGSHARHPSQPISQHFRDIAASIQEVTNEIMKRLASTALRLTSSKNLCLAGGVALNCVSNSHIINNTNNIKNIWIQPAAGDAGGALGAALMVGKEKFSIGKVQMSPFLGNEFSKKEIQDVLDSSETEYEHYPDETDYLEKLCDNLIQKKVVGFFEGRMEFGPRSLGNRSILADPRPKNTLNKVNRSIKFREPWRPFAPSILEDEVKNYFEGYTKSPYMLLTSFIKQRYRNPISSESIKQEGASVVKIMKQPFSKYSAISHCDFSSRLQTVNSSNGIFHRLLQTFFNRTRCPMLLNTSFNVRGEPIVCTPKDAVDCFFNTHMDVLAIGGFILKKSDQSAKFTSRIRKTRFNED